MDMFMNSEVVLPSSAGYLVTKIQCDMYPPLPHHGFLPGDDYNKLCTGEWDYLHLGLTSLGRVYLLVYFSLLLLQAGDVERNPGPTPGK